MRVTKLALLWTRGRAHQRVCASHRAKGAARHDTACAAEVRRARTWTVAAAPCLGRRAGVGRLQDVRTGCVGGHWTPRQHVLWRPLQTRLCLAIRVLRWVL